MEGELYSKMILVNVGWMNYYRGFNDDKFSDLSPKNFSEMDAYNFLCVNDYCYGGVRLKNNKINIDRIDPNNNGEYVDDVLVVFTSYNYGNRIVGIYEKARVYAKPVELQTKIRTRKYFFKAHVGDTHLIPVTSRFFKVNDVKIDFVTDANVCFLDNEESKKLRRKIMEWVYDYTDLGN